MKCKAAAPHSWAYEWLTLTDAVILAAKSIGRAKRNRHYRRQSLGNGAICGLLLECWAGGMQGLGEFEKSRSLDFAGQDTSSASHSRPL